MAEQDFVPTTYLTREDSTAIRRVRTLSGRGTFAPGYRLRGEGKSAPSESDMSVNIVKMVSPLEGLGPRDMLSARDYQRNPRTLSVRTVRQARSVAPNTGSRVVRPPRTAVRRMNNAGQGTVGYY